MKATSLIGMASLALNVGLLGVVVAGAFNRAPENASPAPVARAPVAKGADDTVPAAFWSELHSDDPAQQRDRLMAEGFPPQAVRAILIAQIRERFAARRKAAESGMAAQPFWKSPTSDPQVMGELRAIAREEQKLLRELLGPDPIYGAAARLRRQFPDLPEAKVDQLAAIRERYDEQRQEVYSDFRGALTPSDRERIAALEKAMHAEFATVLTPEELENYDLRSSNTANQIRFSLYNFEPTEAEFRAIYRLQSAYDEQYAMTGPGSPEQMRARSDAYRRLREQIGEALGPERYADYQRATDYQFQQASRLVTRLGLPADTAKSLYTVQKEFEERRNAFYRTGSPTNREQVAQAMTKLQQEATARVSTVLGGNVTAIEGYKQYGGSWISSLVPPSMPPGTKK